MPSTTPIYGFPYPLSSDPIADGALDIQNLAEAVEDELALGGGEWFPVNPVAGQYLHANRVVEAGSNTSMTQYSLCLTPIGINATTTVDRISIAVATALANSTVRLGIYTATSLAAGNFTLVLDAGTVATTTTGVKEITISQSLSPGLYFLAACRQGAGAGTLNLVGMTNSTNYYQSNGGLQYEVRRQWYQSVHASVFTSFPADSTTSTNKVVLYSATNAGNFQSATANVTGAFANITGATANSAQLPIVGVRCA